MSDDVIVCYAKCWPCNFGNHSCGPHTWMDDEDIVHAGLPLPRTPEDWDRFAAEKPCGCWCVKEPAA